MEKRYKQLTLEERCKISILQKEGKSIRQIGAIMDRAASTVAREIKRNKTKTKGYDPGYAQVQTASRRWRGSKMDRQPALRNTVLDLLAMEWSPQQIAGRLARELGCTVISHESIYRFIYDQIKRTKNYNWRFYLPRRKSKRGFRGRKGGSSAKYIKSRFSIHERAKEVNTRNEIGHWEGDLMLFSKYGSSILAMQERQSRFLLLTKQPSKAASAVVDRLNLLFTTLPKPFAKTITFDNGSEFAYHHQLHKIGVKTYFCDVSSPWQKGGVENAIGRMRRNLPRKTDLDNLTQEEINEFVARYNHTPRKCLDFKTPAEVFSNQLLHFKCELTFPPARE